MLQTLPHRRDAHGHLVVSPQNESRKIGIFGKKHHVRAAFRSVSFILLLVVCGVYKLTRTIYERLGSTSDNDFTTTTTTTTSTSSLPPFFDSDHHHRRLQTCDITTIEPGWMVVFYIIGVLYLFLATAIVCDEFFVPALEEMSSEHHLNLSMDIAGATLMAAGGSAPELFASFMGTFQNSDIGFGTIVGSAVFNVLFVIAMCSFSAKEVLTLTWWPLARDSSYYVFGLILLAVFMGVVSKGEVHVWEALILFVMYIGYVIFMKYNRKVYTKITGKEFVDPEEEAEEDGAGPEKNGDAAEAAAPPPTPSRKTGFGKSRYQSGFRARLITFIRDPNSWSEMVGFSVVTQIAGDVDATFRHVDVNGDGHVDKDELKEVYKELDCNITDDQFEDFYKELDTDKDGKINLKEFTEFYIRSQKQILNKCREVFDKFDEDKSDKLDVPETKKFLLTIEPNMSEKYVNNSIESMHGPNGDENSAISFEQFATWYVGSEIFNRKMDDVKDEIEGVGSQLKPPIGGSCYQYTMYLIYLPILSVLFVTVPDVRKAGWGKYCYFSFFMSIAWIGVISFFLVKWVELLGNTAGIPSIIMGLTFMAAGTSIPDLLSSVIVAKMGYGDMAVSSSLGSNIFDILVGLPLPWLIYCAVYYPTPVKVGADSVFLNVIILLLMVIAVIVTIHCSGWILSKKVGIMMLVFYGIYLLQAILLELPFSLC